jgi:hypothetical protein
MNFEFAALSPSFRILDSLLREKAGARSTDLSCYNLWQEFSFLEHQEVKYRTKLFQQKTNIQTDYSRYILTSVYSM